MKKEDWQYDYRIECNTENFPRHLKEDIKELESYGQTDDWIMYESLFETLEATAKTCLRHNQITEKEFNTLMRKYGWYCD